MTLTLTFKGFTLPVFFVIDLLGKKGFHTINNLVTVDWSGKIIHVDAGEAGSVHDRTMWSNSALYLEEEFYFSKASVQQYVIGDPEFRGDGPVQSPATPTSLEKDLDGSLKLRDKKMRYQRVVIERVFGIIKQRWEQVLRPTSARKMTDIFYVACLLYNFECNMMGKFPRDIAYLLKNCQDPFSVFDTSISDSSNSDGFSLLDDFPAFEL